MATNFTAKCNDKIPRWFASLNDTHSSAYSMPSRPRTDNIHSDKPSWLADLVQSRRHSEQLSSLFDSIEQSSKSESSFTFYHKTPIKDLMKEHESDENEQEITLNQVNSDKSLGPFEIPSLPRGKTLTLLIESNWGDENFVGLNGIEIFDARTANLAVIEKITFNDCVSDRTAVLIDQVYRSHDEDHIWQVSLGANAHSFPMKLKFFFDQYIHVALIRIWNHNKSRIYWDRGVKNIQLLLDERLIFQGEITRAHGSLSGPVHNLGDTILLTTDDHILEKIAHNDKFFK